MVLEWVGEEHGQMLGKTWDDHKDDATYRKTFFRDLSKIMLSLASIPQPQIGSFRLNMDGTITLSSRPVIASMMILENGTAPRTMATDKTFRSSQSYASAMLDFHDQRFLAQPNAAFDEGDCLFQMTVQTILRLHADRYISQDYNYGPFVLQHTDLHAANIFVDANWNITCLIDLEWICSLPVDMLDVPYWLTGGSIDEICGGQYNIFNEVRQEFMSVWVEVERELGNSHNFTLSQVMERTWQSDAIWFWHSLTSINAMYRLVMERLCPVLPNDDIQKTIAQFWSKEDRDEIVKRKLKDKEKYDQDLKLLFEKYNPGKLIEIPETSGSKDKDEDTAELQIEECEEGEGTEESKSDAEAPSQGKEDQNEKEPGEQDLQCV